MTISEKYKLARWAMNHALNSGAQEVSVNIFDSTSSSIEVREEKIDKLEQANQSGMTIRLMVDRKYSAHSTNRLNNSKELERFIEEAIAGTRFLAEDEYRTLPDPSLYHSGEGEDLKTSDPEFAAIDPQEKIDAAFAIEREVIGKDERIISVTASYSDGSSSRVMVTSNGFEGDTSNTYYGLNASVSVKGGDARPESYWSESSNFYRNLVRGDIGKKALDRALAKIGQGKIESGRLPMIVENRQVGRLLSPVISAMSGSAIQQKNSFLIDRLDSKVASDKLTITDDPFIVSGRASRLFDNEGIATRKRIIFDKGILKTYLIDTYYGKKLGMDPNSGETTNLLFETGEKDIEGLIASLERGIVVTGFNGGNCNGTTGDFSYGIDGFLVENGKITRPVSEMNISGNMKELWMNLAEVGSDLNKNSSWQTPSMLFSGVDFSGI